VFTGIVHPRVSPTGTTVFMEGVGCPDGTVEIRVRAAASGWYDIPPEYFVTYRPTAADGAWSATFSMPVGPATVVAYCFDEAIAVGTIAPAPVGGHYPAPPAEGNDYVVRSAERPEVFAADGTPIAVRPDPSDPAAMRFVARNLPARLVVIGVVDFGENADARQVRSISATTYDIPLSAQAQPTPSSTTITQPPVVSGERLADTGGPPRVSWTAILGALLLLVGLVCVSIARSHFAHADERRADDVSPI
jgi:hypothetical protein